LWSRRRSKAAYTIAKKTAAAITAMPVALKRASS
jgi:hypothetical protein